MAKYLVATKETQGSRKNDFSHCEEGVFVNFHSECDGEKVDGKCGCRRSLSAIGGGATTTFKIVEINDTQATDIVARIQEHYVKNWAMGEADAQKQAVDDYVLMSGLAQHFKVGDILEKRGSAVRLRARKG